MTTEQRFERLEEVSKYLAELMANVVDMSQRQQRQIDDIVDIAQRQQEQLERHQEQLERHQETFADIARILQRQEEHLDEVREDAKMTRRLWVRLAKKYGWLDDEDVEGE